MWSHNRAVPPPAQGRDYAPTTRHTVPRDPDKRRVSHAPAPKCQNEAVVPSFAISFRLFAFPIERSQVCYSPKRADRSSNETQKDNLCRPARTEKSENSGTNDN